MKERAKLVIAEIIQQSAGDTLKGKTRMFKAFYFAHLYYAMENNEHLSDWPIVRMPQGPGIDRFDELIAELVDDGVVIKSSEQSGPYRSEVYRYAAPPRILLGEREKNAVRKAVEYITGKTGSQLSDITHEHSRSWNDASDGEEMAIYVDSLDDEGYEEFRRKSESAVNDLEAAGW